MKKNIAKSLLFGVAVGDALGVPVEFSTRDSLRRKPVTGMRAYGTYNQIAGTWSDDSSLIFCLAESLVEGYSLKGCAEKFIKWRNEAYWTPHGEVFDIGTTTALAIDRLSKIIRLGAYEELDKLNKYGEESENGNGSLMRILPLLYFIQGKDIVEQFFIIWKNSALTHRHIRAAMCCLIYLKIAEFIVKGYPKFQAYERAQRYVGNFWKLHNYEKNEIFQLADVVHNDISQKPEDEIKSDGYVVHSLEASLWCFLNTESYKECVLKAVNLGNDTDTTAAITGGLAGLYYGFENISMEWIGGLARRDDIFELAEKLDKKFG